jgi:hypothetical protein
MSRLRRGTATEPSPRRDAPGGVHPSNVTGP